MALLLLELGNSDGSAGNNPTNPGGSGPGGTSGSGGDGSPISVMPNYPARSIIFIKGLGSPDSELFKQMNYEAQQNIIDYLEENEYAPAVKLKIKAALLAIDLGNLVDLGANLQIAIINYMIEKEFSQDIIPFCAEVINSVTSGGETDIPYQIILDPTFVNNPCLYGVYTQLGKAPAFQNYLHNFDGDFSVANLKIEAISSLPATVNAQTTPPENYLIKLQFNLNNLNRPGLSIARTFIHELIHAEIFRKLLSVCG
ncbi:hypothetical protein [Flavobacterium sp. 3HN19-14]|uniref:hypothetical protein n=1 Tax=Flavobacterium sp. 3HN19-14 TaxID=3448133 RepID=UPI003EDFB3DE